MMTADLAIIIPANNEGAHLPALLRSLCDQHGVTLEVTVVANGCVDDTAAIAEDAISEFVRAGHTLKVMETPVASKPAALNAGDRSARVFPRAYVDADVVLPPEACLRIARALAGPAPTLAGLPLELFTAGSWISGSVARALQSLPPFSDDVVGGGFYAVNSAGRARWTAFPDVVADDAYVVSRFDARERILVECAPMRVRFPADDRLIGVLARWQAGRRELRSLGIELCSPLPSELIKALVGKPQIIPAVLVLVVASALAKIRSWSVKGWPRAIASSTR
jgi:glycosyltransferase involved in cell wall biosynthesis